MSDVNENVAQRVQKIDHRNLRPEKLEIKNGLFRHIVGNKTGRLVCVKLYANGWSITTVAGTMQKNVRLNGDTVEITPSGNIRSGKLVMDTYVPIAKAQRVQKVLIDTIHGQIEMRNEKDSLLEFFINGEKIGYLKNPEKRKAEYSLPDCISVADAAILFCIGMMTVRYDDIDIV